MRGEPDQEVTGRHEALRAALRDRVSADDLPVGDQLRSRALEAAARAYSAAHGHPLERDRAATPARPRWVLDARAGRALVVVLGLALLLVLARHAMAPGPAAGSGEAGGPAAPPAAGTEPAALAPQPAEEQGAVPSDGPVLPSQLTGDVHQEVAETVVLVHVVGQVVEPGLVRVPAGSRVADVVEAAGGPTEVADLTALNLARVVVDGEQIRVPAPGEVVPGTDPPASGSSSPGARVDLNTADAAALDELPGVGPVLAERILQWRSEHGRFSTVEELGEVAGVGPKVLEALRDLVVVH